MSESKLPFDKDKVLWQWKPAKEQKAGYEFLADECVVVQDDRLKSGIMLWGRRKDNEWVNGACSSFVISQLLRERTAAKNRVEILEGLCIEAANELTKTLPANHPLRIRLEQAGDGKEL